MARVAVVIPLFNKERYVARALESVFAQTWQDFEIVVVDDGSTDGGPAALERFRDARLRLLRQPNAGPGAARNRGIAATSSPLVAFLDADDEYLPQFLERSLERLDAHPQCVAALSGCFAREERISTEPMQRALGITAGPWRLSPDTSPVGANRALNFFSPHIVYRREVLEKYGGYYAKNRCTLGEDLYLWIQIAMNHFVYRDPGPLAWYHTEASQLVNQPVKPLRAILSDPSAVRKSAPPEYRHALERWIGYYALIQARQWVREGRGGEAQRLLARFAYSRVWSGEYFRLNLDRIIMALCPSLFQSKVLQRWTHRARTLMQSMRAR